MSIIAILLVIALLQGAIVAGQLVSPCPRLFSYEPQKENDRWYGVVTLISDSDLKGVWLRLVFDKPSLQLGNWFGEIRTTDNTEYLVHNRNHELKANMPYALRFYIKYNPADGAPQLTAFRLNAKTVCPEGQSTTPAAITGGSQLITSVPGGGDSATPRPSGQVASTTLAAPTSAQRPSETFTRPGGGWPGNAQSTTEDDDIFQGDFQLINRPHLRPTIEPECGTVVHDIGRRKRNAYSYDRGGVHQHRGRESHYGQTPNFPKIDFVYVDDQHNQHGGYGQNGAWNLQQWISNFLKQHYSLSDPQSTVPPNSKPYDGHMTHSVKSGDDGPPSIRDSLNPDQVHRTDLRLGGASDEAIAPLEQQPRPLITYGQSTKEGEFPWHAALYHERGADLQYICGASLISRQHVITVAHCVTRRRTATTLNPDSLVVYLGKYYLKKWSNPGIQDSQVQSIIAHPQYDTQSYANDVAILKLVNAATFTDYVRPICLWGDGQGLDAVLSKPGTVVGWGFDHTGQVTEELTQAKMPVVAKETCIYSFPDFFSRFTTSKTYCAGFRNGTSVCNGDSGGGMVFPKATSTPGREIWQLRGLVSISVALQNQFKCDSSHYVVFTDVAKYLDWINMAMKQ